MTDPQDASRDIEWYRSRWDTLCMVLDLDDPEAVVPRVRELQLDMLQDAADADEGGDTRRDAQRSGAKDSVSDERREVIDHLYERLQVLRESNAHLKSIQDMLEVDGPEAAEVAVETLRERVDHLKQQQEALNDAGFTAEQAVRMISTMEAQLDALYREKNFTEAASLEEGGDTFEQLQALLAREERLKRELGVSSIDQVIEMVEGMSEQLNVLYEEIETTAEASTPNGHALSLNGTAPDGAPSGDTAPRPLDTLYDALGVRSPDDVIAMVNSLTRQLEDLYEARETLAQANAADEESIVAMVNNMQHQLESLYESQERMSQKGVQDVDQALSMIDNMEAQLSMLYEERETEPRPDLDDMRRRLQEKTSELKTLKEEKSRLIQERDALRAAAHDDAPPPSSTDSDAPAADEERTAATGQTPDAEGGSRPSSATHLRTLEQNFGDKDPERIAALIHSMDEQMEAQSTAELRKAASRLLQHTDTLLDEDVLAGLEDMTAQELDALDVGAFCLNDTGRILSANAAALRFPGCTARTPEALEGSNFFFDLATSTTNALFRGRFMKGVRNGSLDVQFPYTFIRPQAAPVNLVVRLHRKPTEEANWILFTRL